MSCFIFNLIYMCPMENQRRTGTSSQCKAFFFFNISIFLIHLWYHTGLHQGYYHVIGVNYGNKTDNLYEIISLMDFVNRREKTALGQMLLRWQALWGIILCYVPSQWETTLHCNIVSHWLGAYTKRSPALWSDIIIKMYTLRFDGEFSVHPSMPCRHIAV